ncbi:MAG: GNAT family N-acetyltransferase [Candidatus Thorarchaeota archaeon]|jgi:GNAT superfamily N-acetyltransferase
MSGEVSFEIDFATDWEQYSQAWKTSMQHHYWYKESPVFDFNKEEELDELRSDFEKSDNLFLVAHTPDSEEVVGVLGLRYQEIVAWIRRWEPAIIPLYRGHQVGEALLKQAIEHLLSIGIKRINYLLKHPIGSPGVVESLVSCYRSSGFEHTRPDSVDMVMHLDSLSYSLDTPLDVSIDTGDNYTFKDLASITVKSFTSTPEEREIHGFDKTVTEHIQATALLQRMAEGFYGYSPDEFRKIAVVDGVPAGFLGAFVSESKYKPLTGLLGPMGVLPEYRRRGIGLHLISEVLTTLKEYGCEYAAVGTPALNAGAIKLYEKAGFKLSCRLQHFEMRL